MTKHVVFTSGGVGSWYTGHLVAGRVGVRNCTFLFTDTRNEDPDVYRFLVESVAVTAGRSRAAAPVVAQCRALPPIQHPGFSAAVAAVQAAAAVVLPELVWLADGRNLWELFEQSNFIGNTRVDICSRKLKRDVGRAWIEANCDPAAAVLYFGIDAGERDRFYGTETKPGIAARWVPYRAEAPICDLPRVGKCDMAKVAERLGLDPPSMYDEGFPHANCGGLCVKGGHAQMALLLAARPDYFYHNADKEQEFRARTGKDVAIMRDRRGGITTPLPMLEFARQIESGERVPDPRDWGKGCQCFTPAEADDEGG